MQSRMDAAVPRAQKSKESTTLQFTECTNPDLQQAKKTLSLQAVWEGSCFQESYISNRKQSSVPSGAGTALPGFTLSMAIIIAFVFVQPLSLTIRSGRRPQSSLSPTVLSTEHDKQDSQVRLIFIQRPVQSIYATNVRIKCPPAVGLQSNNLPGFFFFSKVFYLPSFSPAAAALGT